MKTRNEIIDAAVAQVTRAITASHIDHEYLEEVNRVLTARLTEERYLTCEDFALFCVSCCDICHRIYSHFEMWHIDFSDGRHAWVCDPIQDVLTCLLQQEKSSPDQETAEALLAEIFQVDEPSIGTAVPGH
jgi:hypothetical protein